MNEVDQRCQWDDDNICEVYVIFLDSVSIKGVVKGVGKFTCPSPEAVTNCHIMPEVPKLAAIPLSESLSPPRYALRNELVHVGRLGGARCCLARFSVEWVVVKVRYIGAHSCERKISNTVSPHQDASR